MLTNDRSRVGNQPTAVAGAAASGQCGNHRRIQQARQDVHPDGFDVSALPLVIMKRGGLTLPRRSVT